MHQRKLVAQPRRYSTEEKKKWPSTYIPCPKCGTLMAKHSKQCWDCRYRDKKPHINGLFCINGINCRLVLITQGLCTIIEEVDHDFAVQWNWHTSKNMGKYYATRQEQIGNKKQRTVQMHRGILERKFGPPTREVFVHDH